MRDADRRRQVDLAYRLVAGRPPNAKEMQVALDFLKSQSAARVCPGDA